MELNEQVTSLELSEELKKAGVSQKDNTLCVYHGGCLQMRHYYHNMDNLISPVIAAFTSAELGQLLPDMVMKHSMYRLCIMPSLNGWGVSYTDGRNTIFWTWHESQAEAYGLMLCKLINQGIVDTSKLKL